jgi:hypothetical protein
MDQPLASLPPMAYDRRLGSPVMARKPKRALAMATSSNNANLQICFMPEAALDSDDDGAAVNKANGSRQGQDQQQEGSTLASSAAEDGINNNNNYHKTAGGFVDRRIPAAVQPKSMPANVVKNGTAGSGQGSPTVHSKQKCYE